MTQQTTHRSPRRAAALLAACATPALAHHPMGGAIPTTAWQGLLSGVGHPVIGPDHLAFLLTAGLLTAWASGGDRRRAVALGLAFVVSGALGALLRVGLQWPVGLEPLVGASLVLVALGLFAGRMPGTVGSTIAAAVAGIAHGHAFGEAVIGSEATPIAAYLAGLALTQLLLLALAYAAGKRIARHTPGRMALPMRAVGLVTAAVGIAAAGSALPV